MIPLGHRPDALALDPGANWAVVADDAAATVSVLDLAVRRQGKVPVTTIRVAGRAPASG